MDTQNAECQCAEDWTEAEARFHHAKQALLQAQEQHCAAADELLLARAQVRRLLEEVFPSPEGASRSPVSERRLEIRDVCNRAAA